MKWRGPEQAGWPRRRRESERGSITAVGLVTTAGALALMTFSSIQSDMETGAGTDTGSSQSGQSDGDSKKRDKGPRYPGASCSATVAYKKQGEIVAFTIRAAGISKNNLKASDSEVEIVLDPKPKDRYEDKIQGNAPPTTVEVRSNEFDTAQIRLHIPGGDGYTEQNIGCGTFSSPK